MPNLPVPIHLQDTWESCGPACVQMIARSLGAPLEDQATLAQLAQAVKSYALWVTSPDQLCEMLNNAPRPAGAPTTLYRVFLASSALSAIQRAKASIDADLPAVALVDEGTHWVVVTGHTPGGVHLRNPAPPRPPTLPGHNDGDDGCATINEAYGGASGTDVDEYYSWAGWQTECLVPCAISSPKKWLNQFIVVAADVTGQAAPVQPEVARGTRSPSRQPPAQLAIDGLAAAGLSDTAGWRDALRGASAASARGPLLVRAPGGRSYYLVGLEGARGLVLAGTDALTGELLWARLNPTPRLVESLFSALPSGDSTVSAELVWTPARETFFSPFFPLLKFEDKTTTPGPRPTYVRLYDQQRFIAPRSGAFSHLG